MPKSHLNRIAVVVASVGRPDEVGDLVENLERQTLAPVTIVLSVSEEADLPEASRRGNARVVMGELGLPKQRNTGMRAVLDDCDLIAFFDDDYLMARTSLERLADFFTENEDVVGVNGALLADGISRGGVPRSDAIDLISRYESNAEPDPTILDDLEGLYGCNMVYRSSAIGDLEFDENLPLYGWQEDVDFANRLLPVGRLVRTNVFAGVHRGVTRGRTSGVRLGYSQIANPIYLAQKGSMSLWFATRLILRCFIANHVHGVAPEPWVDRRGRVKGNWLAIRDIMKEQLSPMRVLEI